jgi:hypothetical protein
MIQLDFNPLRRSIAAQGAARQAAYMPRGIELGRRSAELSSQYLRLAEKSLDLREEALGDARIIHGFQYFRNSLDIAKDVAKIVAVASSMGGGGGGAAHLGDGADGASPSDGGTGTAAPDAGTGTAGAAAGTGKAAAPSAKANMKAGLPGSGLTGNRLIDESEWGQIFGVFQQGSRAAGDWLLLEYQREFSEVMNSEILNNNWSPYEIDADGKPKTNDDGTLQYKKLPESAIAVQEKYFADIRQNVKGSRLQQQYVNAFFATEENFFHSAAIETIPRAAKERDDNDARLLNEALATAVHTGDKSGMDAIFNRMGEYNTPMAMLRLQKDMNQRFILGRGMEVFQQSFQNSNAPNEQDAFDQALDAGVKAVDPFLEKITETERAALKEALQQGAEEYRNGELKAFQLKNFNQGVETNRELLGTFWGYAQGAPTRQGNESMIQAVQSRMGDLLGQHQRRELDTEQFEKLFDELEKPLKALKEDGPGGASAALLKMKLSDVGSYYEAIWQGNGSAAENRALYIQTLAEEMNQKYGGLEEGIQNEPDKWQQGQSSFFPGFKKWIKEKHPDFNTKVIDQLEAFVKTTGKDLPEDAQHKLFNSMAASIYDYIGDFGMTKSDGTARSYDELVQMGKDILLRSIQEKNSILSVNEVQNLGDASVYLNAVKEAKEYPLGFNQDMNGMLIPVGNMRNYENMQAAGAVHLRRILDVPSSVEITPAGPLEHGRDDVIEVPTWTITGKDRNGKDISGRYYLDEENGKMITRKYGQNGWELESDEPPDEASDNRREETNVGGNLAALFVRARNGVGKGADVASYIPPDSTQEEYYLAGINFETGKLLKEGDRIPRDVLETIRRQFKDMPNVLRGIYNRWAGIGVTYTGYGDD